LFSTGGSFLTSAAGNTYGNNVTARSAYLPSGAQKSWLDSETLLPAGKLEAFYFYVHNNTGLGPKQILIQIWRPVSEPYQFMLVWQKNISINQEYTNGALVKVSTSYIVTIVLVINSIFFNLMNASK
jgi:hypothetical protein